MLPHVLALATPILFGMCTWRMEAHAKNYPGQASALAASQVGVVGVTSVAWAALEGGKKEKMTDRERKS